jgi:hypothetical protein
MEQPEEGNDAIGAGWRIEDVPDVERRPTRAHFEHHLRSLALLFETCEREVLKERLELSEIFLECFEPARLVDGLEVLNVVIEVACERIRVLDAWQKLPAPVGVLHPGAGSRQARCWFARRAKDTLDFVTRDGTALAVPEAFPLGERLLVLPALGRCEVCCALDLLEMLGHDEPERLRYTKVPRAGESIEPRAQRPRHPEVDR